MIYLDHNATSPTRPEVAEAVFSCYSQVLGNPSSVHGAGRLARKKLDEARRQVAALVGVHDSQVIFTSGGTEANHLALMGTAARFSFRGRLIVSAVEHPSVLRAGEVLAGRGVDVVQIGVDEQGLVDLEALAEALTPDTFLVSIMHANNETGVVQPVDRISALCRKRGVLFHSDTVQGVAKWPVTLEGVGADMISLSAHKLAGPKGAGALIVDHRLALVPQIVGGGQERGRRAGTENLPGIVGFGIAAELAADSLEANRKRLEDLRHDMEGNLSAHLPNLVIFGRSAPRLANTSSVGLAGLDGETLVMAMDLAGFAISAGSACGSGRTQASHVLSAMGYEGALGQSAVRISLGWNSQPDEIDRFVAAFVGTVERLQRMSMPLTLAV